MGRWPFLCAEAALLGEGKSVSCSVMSDPLRPHRLQPARLLCPWNSPGKNTGVGSHSLLQRIFPTQGLNLGLQDCRQILYHLSHQGSPLLGEAELKANHSPSPLHTPQGIGSTSKAALCVKNKTKQNINKGKAMIRWP